MQEIVFRSNDNQALTTSMIVAEKFGKEHKHVLEAIRNILSTTAPKSAFVDNQQLAKMFALTEVEQPMPAGGVKKIPMYVMNRDGFTLLAMGFTGEVKAIVKTFGIGSYLSKKIIIPAGTKIAQMRIVEIPNTELVSGVIKKEENDDKENDDKKRGDNGFNSSGVK